MKVLNVEHRDIHVTTDFSLQQLQYLRDFLSKSDVSYNSEEEPEMAEAVSYVTEYLFPFLNEFINKLENQG